MDQERQLFDKYQVFGQLVLRDFFSTKSKRLSTALLPFWRNSGCHAIKLCYANCFVGGLQFSLIWKVHGSTPAAS
jgi:hypothetical protein